MLQLATSGDREAVLGLKQQVHSLHIGWRPDLFCREADLYPVEAYLEDIRQRQIYVAKLGDVTVGYVRLKMANRSGPGKVAGKIMMLEEICVERTLRRQGIGTDILADVRALARAFGCDGIRIRVFPQNDGAVTFYQKCGFTIRSIDMEWKT